VVKITNNAGASKVLTSDSIGNGTWQKVSAGKGYNGLASSNDTINFGGRLYYGTNINLTGNQLFFKDIGSQKVDVAISTINTLTTLALGTTPVTQTFRTNVSCKTLYLNVTALAGGIINTKLLDENGMVIDGSGIGFGTLTKGLSPFPFHVYLDSSKNINYQLPVMPQHLLIMMRQTLILTEFHLLMQQQIWDL
jgi:hypothetical protein